MAGLRPVQDLTRLFSLKVKVEHGIMAPNGTPYYSTIRIEQVSGCGCGSIAGGTRTPSAKIERLLPPTPSNALLDHQVPVNA